MYHGISGNAALVTAGTAGLGLASAESLAEAGADVAVCGRNRDRLSQAQTQLEAAGEGDVLALQVDITDRAAVEEFVETAIEEFGGLDHVVTSAGGPPSGAFLDVDDRDWYRAYDLLVMSVVWTVRAAHPSLVEGSGTVVAITSRSTQEVVDDLVLSNSVRRAVIGLMKSLSREFAPDVRVNAVLPGAHETSRIEELVSDAVDRGDFESYEEGLNAWAEGIPMGRIGEPRELGETVAWLCSEHSSYVNGAAVPIDGGSMRSA